MKITKRQLRRIIKEERQKLLKEDHDLNLAELGNEVGSVLVDILKSKMPYEFDYLNEKEFAGFEESVTAGLAMAKEQLARNFSGEVISHEKKW